MHTTHPLQTIRLDISVPVEQDPGKFLYFIAILDDFNAKYDVYPEL